MEYTRPSGDNFGYVRCEKGHFYDPKVSKVCPVCAEEEAAGKTGPAGGSFGAPPTAPVDYEKRESAEDYPRTQPINEGMPGENRTFGPADHGETHNVVDDVDVTRYVGFESKSPEGNWEKEKEFFNPLVGWLVCTEGPSRGMDYRIYSGYNYIGRDPSMDICIVGDAYISHERHAMVTFDSRTGRFYFSPVGGKSIVRLNDEIVLVPVEINPHDVLEIGQSKLMFIPLCDGTFSWK